MKKQMCLLAMFLSIASLAQTEKITDVLNKALDNEIRLQSQIHTEVDTTGTVIGYFKMVDTIVVVTPFEIKNNMLSFTLQRNLNDGGYIIEKQEVPLDKILSISKDNGVKLQTINEDVITYATVYLNDGNEITTKYSTNSLLTYCVTEKQNDYLGDDLVKAFEEAGYTITVSYWYD
jgi:hypothetical protein